MAKTKRTKRKQYQQVDVIPPACPKCGSTKRNGYHNTKTMNYPGITASGVRYDRIIWRRTECGNCGQRIVERSFETLSATRTAEE